MAIFNINTIPSDWSVTKTEISTDCSTRFQYKVVAPAGHVIDISLIGDHLDQYAESNGQELYLPPAGTTGIVFNNTLSFYFIIPNSGVSGSFLDSQVVITNNNSTNADPVYTNTATRENDDQNCDDKGSGGGGATNTSELTNDGEDGVNPFITALDVKVTYNLIIKGATNVGTRVLLAEKFSFVEADIIGYEIIGSDTYATINNTDYKLLTNIFSDDLTITGLIETAGHLTELDDFSLKDADNLVELNCIGLKTVGDGALRGCGLLLPSNINTTSWETIGTNGLRDIGYELGYNWYFPSLITTNAVFINDKVNVYLPRVKALTPSDFFAFEGTIDVPNVVSLGSPGVNTGIFTNIVSGSIINIDISQKTINSGQPDADLIYAIGQGAVVNYVNGTELSVKDTNGISQFISDEILFEGFEFDAPNNKVTNVALVLDTIFVNSVTGNDTSGALENPSLPFQTVDAALAAIPDPDTTWTIHLVNSGTHEINVVIPAKNFTIFSPVSVVLSFDNSPVVGDLFFRDNSRVSYIKFDLPLGEINMRPLNFATFWGYRADITIICVNFRLNGKSEFDSPRGFTFKVSNALVLTGTCSFIKLMPVSIRPIDIDIVRVAATGSVKFFESSITPEKGGDVRIGSITGGIFWLHQEIESKLDFHLGDITLSTGSLSTFANFSGGGGDVTYFMNDSIITGKIKLAYANLKVVGNMTFEQNDERAIFLYRTFLSFGSITYNGTGESIFLVGNNGVIENSVIENFNIVNNHAGGRLIYNYEGSTSIDFLGIPIFTTKGYCSYQGVTDGDFLFESNQFDMTNMKFLIYGDFSTNAYIQNKTNGSSVTVEKFFNTYGLNPLLDDDASIGVAEVIDWNKGTSFFTMIADTVFNEINLPTIKKETKVITVYLEGAYVPLLPTEWTTGNHFTIVGAYDPAKRNQIVVEYLKAGHYWILITQDS